MSSRRAKSLILRPQYPTREALIAAPRTFQENLQHVRWRWWRSHEFQCMMLIECHFTGAQIKNGTAFDDPAIHAWCFNSGRGYPDWAVKAPGGYTVTRANVVLYAGSTSTSLEARLAQHHKIWLVESPFRDSSRTILIRDSDTVSFYKCDDGYAALRFEQDLYEFFKPPYNTRAPMRDTL